MKRTVWAGTFGVWKAAGFRTDDGATTVLFLPDAGRVGVVEQKTPRGYRYTLRARGRPTESSREGASREYYVARGNWFIMVLDPHVAAVVRRALVQNARRS